MLQPFLCGAVISGAIAVIAIAALFWLKHAASMKALRAKQPVVQKFDDNGESVDEYMARQMAKAPLVRLPAAKLSGAAQQHFSSELEFKWPALGEFDFEVVGESHYQQNIRRIVGSHSPDGVDFNVVAILTPEDDNPYDPKAVSISIDGSLVGYLPREDARSFRRRLTQKGFSNRVTECDALIRGGFSDKDGAVAMYGVWLDIKPF